MSATTPHYVELPGGARLSHGAEEFVFVELSEAFDLAVSLQVQSLAAEIVARDLDGVVDVVPAHVSYMLRVDPDVLDPRDLVPVLTEIHAGQVGGSAPAIATRVVEIPMFYADPWTAECTARFRDRHPSPDETDLEFVARVNGFASVEALVAAHAAHPWIVTFNNFVPGNAECVQLVPREQQIEAPKYLRPRTDTPRGALGHGGNQMNIYPAQSPGGFQLLGRTPLPIVDFTMTGPGFVDSPALLTSPTIISFAPIDHGEYDAIESALAAGTFTLREAAVEFELDAFDADPLGYARSLAGELR